MLGHGLDNAVAGADVVKQEIAVGMKLLICHGSRNGECASVQLCACSRSGQGLNVALVAANFAEELFALARFGSGSELGIARRSFGGANEARKVIDVGKPVGARLVIRFLNRVAKIRNFKIGRASCRERV